MLSVMLFSVAIQQLNRTRALASSLSNNQGDQNKEVLLSKYDVRLVSLFRGEGIRRAGRHVQLIHHLVVERGVVPHVPLGAADQS